MKRHFSASYCVFVAAMIGAIAPRLEAQPANVTRPDFINNGGDLGTCTEGDTEYSIAAHAQKRCGPGNIWWTVFTTNNTLPASSGGSQSYNATSNGMVCNDSTDDTAAFNTLLATLYAAGGGTIYLPSVCLISGAIVFPNDSATIPHQPPIRITGIGMTANGAQVGSTTPAKSGLDMRYNAAVAKLDTRGLGYLEIDHLALTDGGSDCAAFIQTTNTTMHIHDVYFSGTAAGQAACNDAIVLGGTIASQNGLASSGFSGYQPVIDSNFFHQIRRGVYMRVYANAVTISNNFWDLQCGAADTTTAALDFLSSVIEGVTVTGNSFEVGNYPWTIHVTSLVQGNSFLGNNFFDATVISLAFIRLDSGSLANLVLGGLTGLTPGPFPAVAIDNQDARNQILTSDPGAVGGITSRIFLGTLAIGYPGTPNDKIQIWGTNTNTNTALGSNVGVILQNQSVTAGNYMSILNYNSASQANSAIYFKNVDQVFAGSIDMVTRASAGVFGIAMRLDKNGGWNMLTGKGQHINTFAAASDLAGTVTVTNPATTGVLNFTLAFTSAPVCIVTPTTNQIATIISYWVTTSGSALTVTVGTSPSAAISFNYVCVGNPN